MRSNLPKVLHDVCGRPLVGWPVAAAREAGADRVVVVDGTRPRCSRACSATGSRRPCSRSRTGPAARSQAAARRCSPRGPVLVLGGDAPLIDGPTLQALVDAHVASGAAGDLLSAERPRGPERLRAHRPRRRRRRRAHRRDEDGGRCDAAGAGDRARSTPASTPSTPRRCTTRCARWAPTTRRASCYLPTCSRSCAREGAQRRGARRRRPGSCCSASTTASTSRSVRDARSQRRILEAHMRAGRRHRSSPRRRHRRRRRDRPRHGARADRRSLRGATRVGGGSPGRAGDDDHRRTVGDGVDGPHALRRRLPSCTTASRVGPFAYLRPGTVLRARSKAGTFVELKNSDIGEGTKVPHLSYLGDADVGPGTNIGAANVTANYDGVRKHRTTIGAGVQDGSVDTTFVAPVHGRRRRVDGAPGAVVTQGRAGRRVGGRARAPGEHRGLRRPQRRRRGRQPPRT